MVMAYAGRPVLRALEIGAGTVRATVRTVRAAFEDLRPAETYGLVYAAAALHWTNPEGRWPRIAALLEPDGVFVSFGGPVQLADPALEVAVRAARAPDLESDDIPSPDGTPPEQDMQVLPETVELAADIVVHLARRRYE